ncbi:frataxin domain-containing protein, partial [Vibrio parahaemolyticus]|nr:iron donor protein CyaY [Vibrio parahaemolyticus]
YHYDYKDNDWVCDRSGQRFTDMLAQAIATQSGEPFAF